MGKVILDMSVSLDGFVGKPGDYRLHNWYFSNEADANREVVDEIVQTMGVNFMGRRTYDLAASLDGFVDSPYNVPHFVVTHHVPEKLAKGTTPFTFVTDGIERAIQQAIEVAGDKAVVIGGGANVAQQCLKAGLIDELFLHVVPVLLGGGLRLFDQFEIEPIELEQIQVIAAPGVTHLRFRVVK